MVGTPGAPQTSNMGKEGLRSRSRQDEGFNMALPPQLYGLLPGAHASEHLSLSPRAEEANLSHLNAPEPQSPSRSVQTSEDVCPGRVYDMVSKPPD